MRPGFLGKGGFLGALFSALNPEAQDIRDRMRTSEPFPDKVEPNRPSEPERTKLVLVVDNSSEDTNSL